MRGMQALLALVLCWGLCASPTTYAKKPNARTKQVNITPQLATLTRKTSFRSGLCWRRFYDARRSIQRQRWLLLKYNRYPCDKRAWRRCRRRNFTSAGCRGKAVRLRFGACFRIHRRLFVISYRLLRWRTEARKARCRWRLTVPASFAEAVFAPYPKLSKK